MYKHIVKRLIDLVLSSVAIIVLAIPMLVVAIAIKIDDPGPVLFKQRRVGKKKNGEITYFMMWKFRSMKMSAPHEVATRLLENPDQHITRLGKFIRKTSIDELPQIYQVFTGKMSFVGPRPHVWTEQDLIAEREKYGANDVKPGITGWAQINGRDNLMPAIKAKYDSEYVTALNAGGVRAFVMDMKCVFGTVTRVLRAEDVVEGKIDNVEAEQNNNRAKELVKQ